MPCTLNQHYISDVIMNLQSRYTRMSIVFLILRTTVSEPPSTLVPHSKKPASKKFDIYEHSNVY